MNNEQLMLLMNLMNSNAGGNGGKPTGGSFLDRPFSHPSYQNKNNWSNRDLQNAASLFAARLLDAERDPDTKSTPLTIPKPTTTALTTTQNTAPPAFNFGQTTQTPAQTVKFEQMASKVLLELKEMRGELLLQSDDIEEMRDELSLATHGLRKVSGVTKKMATNGNYTDLVEELNQFEEESNSFLMKLQKKREISWSKRVNSRAKPKLMSPDSVSAKTVTTIEEVEEERSPRRKVSKNKVHSTPGTTCTPRRNPTRNCVKSPVMETQEEEAHESDSEMR